MCRTVIAFQVHSATQLLLCHVVGPGSPNGLVRWTGYRFVMRQSLRCLFQIPACAPKQGTLLYLLHLCTEM